MSDDVELRIADHSCARCRAIFFGDEPGRKRVTRTQPKGSVVEVWWCPECGRSDDEYDPDRTYRTPAWQPMLPFPNVGWADELRHGLRVMSRPYTSGRRDRISPIHELYNALAHATNYIHFTTWGISPEFVAALKILSYRAEVFGIVSRASARTQEILEELGTEGARFYVHALPARSD
jgi:hypothetical protein